MPRPSGAATSSRGPTWAGNGSAQGGCGERHAVQEDGQIGAQALRYHSRHPVVRLEGGRSYRSGDRRPGSGRRHQLRRYRRHLRQGPLGHTHSEGRRRRSSAGRSRAGAQSVVLATKVAAVTGPGANDRGLSRKHLTAGRRTRACAACRPTTSTSTTCTSPTTTTPLEESLDTLNDLVRQGKILYIGMSNYYAWQVCKAVWHADKKNLAGIDCIQMVYNLLARDSELEMTKLCEAEGIGINVWGALAGGMLSGRFLEYDPEQAPASGSQAVSSDLGSSLLRRRHQGQGDRGREESLPVRLWPGCSATRFVSSIVCGVSSVEQLEENLGALDLELSAEDLRACDEVWQAAQTHSRHVLREGLRHRVSSRTYPGRRMRHGREATNEEDADHADSHGQSEAADRARPRSSSKPTGG